MLKCILSLFLLSLSILGRAQVPQWIWAKSGTGSGHEYGQKITDGGLVIGNFTGDTLIIGADTLINHGNGTSDVFVAGYDYFGIPIWAMSFGGPGSEEGLDIINGTNSSICITGYYYSDSLSLDTTMLFNPDTSTRQMFIMALDYLGNINWAKSMGGTGKEEGRSITGDGLNSIYVTGSFESNNIVFANDTLNPVDSSDIFIAKYDDQGNELWARSMGGTNYETANGICAEYNGNIYIIGTTYSDSIYAGNDTIVNFGNGDIIVSKYNLSGDVMWAKNFGGSAYDEGNAIENTSYPHKLYVTGAFQSDTAFFATDTLYNFDMLNSRDVFVASFDTAGTTQWSHRVGGEGDETGYDLSIGSYLSDNIYVVGNTGSTLFYAGQSNFTTNGGTDFFVLTYNDWGSLYWATVEGGSGNEYGYSITANYFEFLCTGSFESATVVMDTCHLYNSGNNDMFVARYTFPTGINIQNKTTAYLHIYPNPTSETFTVALPEGAQTLQVMNIAGQLIYSENVSGKKAVEYTQLQSGLYFITVTAPEGKITGKVTIVN